MWDGECGVLMPLQQSLSCSVHASATQTTVLDKDGKATFSPYERRMMYEGGNSDMPPSRQ